MDAAFEQRIRERAYAHWQAAGMDHGSDETHWLSAEHAVRTETEEMCSATLMPAKNAKSRVAKPAVVKSTAAKPASKGPAKAVGAKSDAKPASAKAPAPRKVAKDTTGAIA